MKHRSSYCLPFVTDQKGQTSVSHFYDDDFLLKSSLFLVLFLFRTIQFIEKERKKSSGLPQH